MNETLTENMIFENGIPPQTLNNSRASTGGIDMSRSRVALFTLYIGSIPDGGSVSAWLQESTDDFDSDVPTNDTASSLSNSNGSNLSSTGNITSNSVITFEVRGSVMTMSKRYLRLQVKETGGQPVPVCVVAQGFKGNYRSAGADNGTHCLTNGDQLVVN